ncbi:hypothetical protein Cgig2_015863 [Carnegiea gigantea]|uniref:Uncharacterized protein n=1 Tax=Carnegiea gigantea TaxID=171969 RepID=A0A9Q1JLT6_9CARY|nr:hypothetical protein Cgig2_015863 [Carnegiea gigantea]
MKVTNAIVRRILIDTGSSGQEVNPTGAIRLPLSFGDKRRANNVEVDFLAYNIILGRPTLHKVKRCGCLIFIPLTGGWDELHFFGVPAFSLSPLAFLHIADVGLEGPMSSRPCRGILCSPRGPANGLTPRRWSPSRPLLWPRPQPSRVYPQPWRAPRLTCSTGSSFGPPKFLSLPLAFPSGTCIWPRPPPTYGAPTWPSSPEREPAK